MAWMTRDSLSWYSLNQQNPLLLEVIAQCSDTGKGNQHNRRGRVLLLLKVALAQAGCSTQVDNVSAPRVGGVRWDPVLRTANPDKQNHWRSANKYFSRFN